MVSQQSCEEHSIISHSQPHSAHLMSRKPQLSPRKIFGADITNSATNQTIINPLKGRGVNWLHFAIQV